PRRGTSSTRTGNTQQQADRRSRARREWPLANRSSDARPPANEAVQVPAELTDEDFAHYARGRADHRERRPVERPVLEEAPPELLIAADVDPARLEADLLGVDLILGQVVAALIVQLLHLADRGLLARRQCQVSRSSG